MGISASVQLESCEQPIKPLVRGPLHVLLSQGEGVLVQRHKSNGQVEPARADEFDDPLEGRGDDSRFDPCHLGLAQANPSRKLALGHAHAPAGLEHELPTGHAFG